MSMTETTRRLNFADWSISAEKMTSRQIDQFVNAVATMRSLQTEFFRSHDHHQRKERLRKSIQAESVVDQMIHLYKSGQIEMEMPEESVNYFPGMDMGPGPDQSIIIEFRINNGFIEFKPENETEWKVAMHLPSQQKAILKSDAK